MVLPSPDGSPRARFDWAVRSRHCKHLILTGWVCQRQETRRTLWRGKRIAIGEGEWGLFGSCYANGFGSDAAFGDRGPGRLQATREKPPVLAAFLQVHVHDLEGHVLRAVIAHERGGLQVTHADLQLQLHLRSRGEVPADGRHATAQARGLDL